MVFLLPICIDKKGKVYYHAAMYCKLSTFSWMSFLLVLACAKDSIAAPPSYQQASHKKLPKMQAEVDYFHEDSILRMEDEMETIDTSHYNVFTEKLAPLTSPKRAVKDTPIVGYSVDGNPGEISKAPTFVADIPMETPEGKRTAIPAPMSPDTIGWATPVMMPSLPPLQQMPIMPPPQQKQSISPAMLDDASTKRVLHVWQGK